MSKFSTKEFLEKLDRFLKDLECYPLIKKQFSESGQVLDLFRFYYMDQREQEIIQSARDRGEDDPWGLKDMLDD